VPPEPSSTDLLPHLLYRVEEQEARFATWRMNEGHEALAIFTTAQTAAAYCQELANSAGWITHQPPRQQFVDILAACRDAGILYAALDPINGRAKTLFDIPRVLASSANSEV
jgi:hypothetical protein